MESMGFGPRQTPCRLVPHAGNRDDPKMRDLLVIAVDINERIRGAGDEIGLPARQLFGQAAAGLRRDRRNLFRHDDALSFSIRGEQFIILDAPPGNHDHFPMHLKLLSNGNSPIACATAVRSLKFTSGDGLEM